MHGCNFESDRRRKVGSGSLNAKERYVRSGGRTESNRKQPGGEVVHRLMLGLVVEAPAPAGEQLRTTYTERYRTRVPFRTPEREVDRAAQPFHFIIEVLESAGCESVEETGQGFDSLSP